MYQNAGLRPAPDPLLCGLPSVGFAVATQPAAAVFLLARARADTALRRRPRRNLSPFLHNFIIHPFTALSIEFEKLLNILLKYIAINIVFLRRKRSPQRSPKRADFWAGTVFYLVRRSLGGARDDGEENAPEQSGWALPGMGRTPAAGPGAAAGEQNSATGSRRKNPPPAHSARAVGSDFEVLSVFCRRGEGIRPFGPLRRGRFTTRRTRAPRTRSGRRRAPDCRRG